MKARKLHVYMWLGTASFKSTARSKTRLFSSPFHVFTSSRVTLAGAFHSDHVDACSTTLHSSTEEKESGAYLTVPCPSNVKQHSSIMDWLKFQ